jgi:hypothetical protein
MQNGFKGKEFTLTSLQMSVLILLLSIQLPHGCQGAVLGVLPASYVRAECVCAEWCPSHPPSGQGVGDFTFAAFPRAPPTSAILR